MANSKGTTEEVQLVTADSTDGHKEPIAAKAVLLKRVGNSFGFTLRHFVVYPPEVIKSRNPNEVGNEPRRAHPIDTVFVRQVSPGGPADKAGLSSGDQVVSVNGLHIINKSYHQVIELIQKSQDSVELGIVPKEECVLQMVSPMVTETPPLKVVPPPTKPKPRHGKHNTSAEPTNVMSTITIAPTQPPDSPWKNSSVTVNLSNKPHDPPAPPTVTRRSSVDRTAQENRAFVVSSSTREDEVNNNSNNGTVFKGNQSSHGNSSNQFGGGTYFFAATDHTGKPRALHFQRGSSGGDSLTVVDRTKTRSRSLPAVEMEGLQNWEERRRRQHQNLSHQNGPQISVNQNSLQINLGEPQRKTPTSNGIPQFVLSSPRVVASDGPSTVNVSTNSEFMSRQPVARDPVPRKISNEESSSYLVRTIASHVNHDRSGGLQSSTMGATLLESQPERMDTLSSGSKMDGFLDGPHPAKHPRHSDSENSPYVVSNEVSVYPNQAKAEEIQLSISSESGDHFSISRNQPSFEERRTKQAGTSPRQRRTSYLMATSATGKAPVSKPLSATHGGVVKKTPTLSSALSSGFMTPMMVHVSSGTEICEDTSKGPQSSMDDDEDEIFVEGDTAGAEDPLAPRIGRRISYVMATSSPSSCKTPQIILEEMKEEGEDDHHMEAVPGLMEVIKEGFLWKKLVVGGGGKRSSVRSWKPVYVVLRGHILYFFKDKDAAHHTKMGDGGDDQQPISIKSSIVDIAHDYTKRKNVFRLTAFNGCEYLFQSEDRSSMMKWIAAIQANNNPDEDESGVTSQSLIIRRMRNVEQESTGNTHSSSNKLTPAGSSAKMPNFSNLKKSLSFKNISGIQKGEGSKTNQSHKKKRKKQSPNITNYVPGHSIGVPLELCPCSKVNKCIPILVEHCCEVVDIKGLDTVGVYRVPGNSAAVSILHDEINSRGAENVNFEEEKWHDVNNITSLLKQFLRKLPEGLITAELYEPFIEANKKEDPVERMWALKCLINDLPEHNYETLKFLLAHLKRVSDNAEKNKMEARNLAIVFGPTLVRTGEDTMISMVKDMSDQCRIVETLLTHNEWFFEEGVDGDDPPSKPPVDSEGRDHFVSMSVLSSLGQAAGNFGEDGNVKSKPGGLAHISLHIPKFRGKHTKSESHDSSSPEAVTSDGSASPTLDRATQRITGTGSCPSSPTLERHKMAVKKGADLSSLSTGSMTNVEIVDADSKARGASSLKAYSYARPPPPSYRKVGPQRMPASPSGDQPQDSVPIFVTFGHPGGDTNENKAELEVAHDMDSVGHPSKPTFASLSEETRLRLLKVSLHQKALEKKRQSEGSAGLTRSHPDVSEELPHETLLAPTKNADHEVSDSTEHLSSSNTSRSSSTPSSKTASLDSLHLPSTSPNDGDGRKNIGSYPGTRVTTGGGWKASLSSPHLSTTPVTSQTVDSLATSQTSNTSSETVVTIVQGKGVVSSGSGEAKRRPSSSDIRARRNTAESLRVRPSMQSESSDSSSEDEGELALSMSKTFDEKLRILLDLDYSFKGQAQQKTEEEEESSSVSSERPRKMSSSRQRRQAEEPSDRESLEDVRGSNSSLAVSTPERKSSLESRHSEPRRFSSESNHVESTETRTSIQIEPRPRNITPEKVIPVETPLRSPERRPSSTPETSKKVIDVGATKGKKKQDKPLQSERASKMGRVHTTTPVALKEFKIAGSTFKKDPGVSRREVYSAPGQSARVDSGLPKRSVHKDSPIVKARTEESSIMISPRSSLGSSRGSFSDSPRSSVTDSSPRNSRSEININLSRSPKPSGPPEKKAPGKYAAMAARSHVPPKVMGREPAPKTKTYPNRDTSGRTILPSRSRYCATSREPTREKHAHKLETNAQHIAALLEEMHSERYLKMTRQRSDISGQAQKAAAQRSASRRRRRSLGDENNEMQKQQTEANESLYSGRV